MLPFLEIPKARTREVVMFGGDLPDWFYTLMLEDGMEEFFCIEGVTPRDLALHLWREYRVKVDFSADGRVMVMRVPPM